MISRRQRETLTREFKVDEYWAGEAMHQCATGLAVVALLAWIGSPEQPTEQNPAGYGGHQESARSTAARLGPRSTEERPVRKSRREVEPPVDGKR